MNEDQVRHLLRELRDEPVPADSLARVRGRVAERIAAKSGTRPLWRWVGAAMIATAVVAIMMLPKPDMPSRPAAPPVVADVQYAPVKPAPVPAKSVVRKALVKPLRRIENVTSSGPPVLIRIETPDPNVVILLIGDGD